MKKTTPSKKKKNGSFALESSSSRSMPPADTGHGTATAVVPTPLAQAVPTISSGSGPIVPMIPHVGIGGATPTAESYPPMSKGDYLLQGFEAEVSRLRIANQMLRDKLKEEASAHAETKRAKDELTQVQDKREERSTRWSSNNVLASDRLRLTKDNTRLMKKVSKIEDELEAESIALKTLEVKRKRQLQVLREQLLAAQRLSESFRKERDAFKNEKEALDAQVDRLKDELDELKENSDAHHSELEKAIARSDKLLGERTKVSAALQDYRRRIKEQSTVAQRNITVLQQKIEHLQSLHQTSLAEVRTVEALAEARQNRNQAVHQQHIDLQRKYDQLSADFRRTRSEHQNELDRRVKRLDREHKVKLAKRDAHVAQQLEDLQRRFRALQRADNSPMVPTGNSMLGTGQRNANPPYAKGKGKSKTRFALTGNKRGFSGGNPPALKAQKIERSNNRRSVSKSKSRSPTRSPAGAGLGSYHMDKSGSVITTHSRIGAGDIVAQDGTVNEDAFKEYLERQDEDDAEFVFSDSDGKEREATHGGDGTDDVSDAGTESDVESVDQQNQQDGPTGQGRK